MSGTNSTLFMKDGSNVDSSLREKGPACLFLFTNSTLFLKEDPKVDSSLRDHRPCLPLSVRKDILLLQL